MAIPTPLLETVIMDIAAQVLDRFALAEEVNISIKKLQPPITNFEGSAGVSYELKRD